MVVYIPPIWLVLLVWFLSVLLLMTTRKRRKKQLPPGPPRLPILGNLHQLGALPHRSLWRLSKKYGPVMFLQLGRVPTVVISSAEAARQALKDHDLDCCSRPSLVGPRRLSYNHKDVSFSPYDHHCREMRKLCVLQLLSAKRVQEFQHIRQEEVASLVNTITQSTSCHVPVNLSDKCLSLTASIVLRAAFGMTCDGSEFTGTRLHQVVKEAMEVLGDFPASDFFPYLGPIIDRLTGLNARLENSFHELDTILEHLVDDHLNPARNKQEHEDIVDVLLRVDREQYKIDGVQFSKDNIKAILMNIFLAGVDTSAVTITWAMAELARKPEIMAKAQQEVRSCIGKKGKVTESDINELKYLKLIVKETLRLYSPVPLLLPREALSHFKLNGYDVHPKTRIIVNAWAIGRDDDHWNNPEEFFPDRFLDNSKDFKGQSFEYIPFGAGRRICPGITMGTTIVDLTLANLLYWFDWKLPNGMKENDIDMEDAPGLAVSKKAALHLVPLRYKWKSENI